MPTKRKRIARSWAAPVSEARLDYLRTGVLPEGDGFWDAFTFEVDGDVAGTWAAVRGRELDAWIAAHPGRRPWAWWEFDASEPRRRLGGVGMALHDCLNYKPRFAFGLPATGWVTAFDVAYYRGLAVDVSGAPIGQAFAGREFPYQAFDPADPPRFESQAAYLERHGAWTAGERRRLPADAFEPEVIVMADTEDSDGAR